MRRPGCSRAPRFVQPDWLLLQRPDSFMILRHTHPKHRYDKVNGILFIERENGRPPPGRPQGATHLDGV